MTGPAARGPAAADLPRWRTAGGLSALAAATTFVVGIALFAGALSDYATGDPTPAESVDFLVAHQGTLVAWYIVIFIVFGVALVPLTFALHEHLAATAPRLAQLAATFGLFWAVLVMATGMIANIGVEVVADLAATDADRAATVWSALDAVTNGLGGGNELAGAAWIGLISIAGRGAPGLSGGLRVTGVATATAGLATLAPGFEAAEMAFGLGSIIWFVWVGQRLLTGRGRVSPDGSRVPRWRSDRQLS